MNPLVGVLLIVLPLLFYQDQPEAPLNRTWEDGQYRLICIFCGFLGGALMARRENGTLGFRWAGGAMGGATTAGLSYYASEKMFEDAGESSANIFIILICSLPGLIAYLVVKRCSDYTFPEHSSHHFNTSHRESKNSGSGNHSSEYAAQQSTPLLIATKI